MVMSVRYFENVEVGEDLPPLRKGPLTTMHLMRWSAATENWQHDRLPGLLVNGSLKQKCILQALKDWVGLEGWVWKVSYQFRAMDLVNSELTVWGRVTTLERQSDFGLAKLQLGIRNSDGRESTPGSATVALPYRGGPAIAYPFVPPST